MCSVAEVNARTGKIYDTLFEIFMQAQREQRAPSEIAHERARRILQSAGAGERRLGSH
jgi:hypothetical protein